MKAKEITARRARRTARQATSTMTPGDHSMTDSMVGTVGDDEVLRALISRFIRRRAAGFTPFFVVSEGENDALIFDTNLGPDELEEFIEKLPTIQREPLDEPEDC
jgi:hypothetical protein